tara:strand:- start:2074 stop:2286 length:213 start_codon:yes stop_codon:yes gene_type:complete
LDRKSGSFIKALFVFVDRGLAELGCLCGKESATDERDWSEPVVIEIALRFGEAAAFKPLTPDANAFDTGS